MMTQPTCETCRFYVPTNTIGQCRRHAPAPQVWGYGNHLLKAILRKSLDEETDEYPEEYLCWPGTWKDDFCGEHEPKEPTDADT